MCDDHLPGGHIKCWLRFWEPFILEAINKEQGMVEAYNYLIFIDYNHDKKMEISAIKPYSDTLKIGALPLTIIRLPQHGLHKLPKVCWIIDFLSV